MSRMRLGLGVLSVLICPAAVVAAVPAAAVVPVAAPPAPPALPEPLSWNALLQLGLGLVLVVGLILLLAWLVRRVNGVSAAGRGVKVLAAIPLGQRERAVLIQVGEQQMLLGVAPGRVNLLVRFDEPVVDSAEVRGAAFAGRLQQVLSRGSER